MVTPFGLIGTSGTFQRYINSVLRQFLDHFVLTYLDDILIYTLGSKANHFEKVRLVFSKLKGAGLYLDPDKCEFGVKTIKYLLGFIRLRYGFPFCNYLV